MKIKVKIDEQEFEVEINDLTARPIVALVDGQCFEVWPEEETSPAPAPAGKAPSKGPLPPHGRSRPRHQPCRPRVPLRLAAWIKPKRSSLLSLA